MAETPINVKRECVECKKEIDKKDKFCKFCGEKQCEYIDLIGLIYDILEKSKSKDESTLRKIIEEKVLEKTGIICKVELDDFMGDFTLSLIYIKKSEK